MSGSCNCSRCPAFRLYCEGCVEPCRYHSCNSRCAACPVRCGRRDDLDEWLAAIGGRSAELTSSLALDVPLQPQPPFLLAGYFPQLLNGLEVPSALFRRTAAGDVAVGIAKVLTPTGRVSRRALPWEFGPHDFRAQWGISEITRLVCIGNYLDGYLERLWAAQLQDEGLWMRARVLGFDFATSLNFSIYLDQPRMEHLVNVKRTWLTVHRMQETSTLIPIPHLQWATVLDLQRRLHYAQEQGFHTLTMNLQMVKRQGWDTVATGIPLIREQMPDLHILFTGVVGLKRMAQLTRAFRHVSFTSTTPHYLAQRYVRLDRDGTRLIKEPVEGHPDLILAENVRLYREFLDETNGRTLHAQASPATAYGQQAALDEVAAALREQFGFEPQAADDAFDLLAGDEAILEAFRTWLRTGELDRDFRGSFPTCGVPLAPALRSGACPLRWPCSGCVSHPTLGELLGQGADPLDAFLHLAHLARRVNEEIQVFVGQAGY